MDVVKGDEQAPRVIKPSAGQAELHYIACYQNLFDKREIARVC